MSKAPGADSVIRNLLAKFQRSGRAIAVNFRQMASDAGYESRPRHNLHPYPAKLLPQIPYLFMQSPLFSKRGNRVFDPFCGSGTVLVEAQLAGRRAVGSDRNPLAVLLSRVKTQSIDRHRLTTASRVLIAKAKKSGQIDPPDVVNIDYWYYPRIIRDLSKIAHQLSLLPASAEKNFLEVCFSRTAIRLSLADPRISVPVRLKPGNFSKKHPFHLEMVARLRALKRRSVFASFEESVADALRRSRPEPGLFGAKISQKDAIKPPKGGKVDLIITSPPYPGAQKYIRSSSLSLGWLGLATVKELRGHKLALIGREEVLPIRDHADCKLLDAQRKIRVIAKTDKIRASVAHHYLIEMRLVLKQLHSALKSKGHLILIAGDSMFSGKTFPTAKYLREIALSEGFRCKLIATDKIRSRALLTKRHKTASTIAAETIMVFSKK